MGLIYHFGTCEYPPIQNFAYPGTNLFFGYPGTNLFFGYPGKNLFFGYPGIRLGDMPPHNDTTEPPVADLI